MKENKLTIIINKPVAEVFTFGINPINTPDWVESIIQEEVDGFPIKVGSIYKNTSPEGVWSEYTVSKFDENKLFELTDKSSSYKVKYTFTQISENQTELEYLEWMEDGELSSPFPMKSLRKLKELIEI